MKNPNVSLCLSINEGWGEVPQPGPGQGTPALPPPCSPSLDQDRVPTPHLAPAPPSQQGMPQAGYGAGCTPLAFSRRITVLYQDYFYSGLFQVCYKEKPLMHYKLLNDENICDLKQNTSLPQNTENKVNIFKAQSTEEICALFQR